MSGLFNIIWFLLIGWWSSLCFLAFSGIFAIIIIGLLIAKALYQFSILNAFPFGKEIIQEVELKGRRNVSGLRIVCGFIINLI